MKHILISLITLYQKTLSRDTGWLGKVWPGPVCRFHPTCSEYSKQAIQKFGCVKGTWLGFRRIIKCHPWNKGGVDKLR